VLEVDEVWKSYRGVPAVRALTLHAAAGSVVGLLGPNGSGKSTTAKVLSGHPAYEVTEGEVLFRGENLLEMEVDERARAGLFLAFQYPIDIPGVSIANFLRTAMQARNPGEEVDIFDFQEQLLERMASLVLGDGHGPRDVVRRIMEDFDGWTKAAAPALRDLVQPFESQRFTLFRPS